MPFTACMKAKLLTFTSRNYFKLLKICIKIINIVVIVFVRLLLIKVPRKICFPTCYILQREIQFYVIKYMKNLFYNFAFSRDGKKN